MAEITVTPIVLKDIILEIDSDDFAAAVSRAELVPATSTVVFKGLKPGSVHTDVTAATWTLQLVFAQDWVTPGSLSSYLLANEGATKAATLKPQSGLGTAFEVDIVITPGAAGGTVDQTATATVTLGVKGKPDPVPAAVGVPVMVSIAPTAGDDGGGEIVTIRGRGFTGATGVHFNATAAGDFTVASDTLIYAVTPADTAGTYAVKVTNATGQSTTSVAFELEA